MKKYNEDGVNFVKLGNYVITLMSAVLRENNQICVRAILSFLMKPEVFCFPNTSATASAKIDARDNRNCNLFQSRNYIQNTCIYTRKLGTCQKDSVRP